MGLVITAILYVSSVVALILTRVRVLKKGKILFKVTSSLLFLALWIVSSIGRKLIGFDYMILISLIFYMSGDILLVLFRSKTGFIVGITAFLTGNIIMIFNLILYAGVGYLDIPILVSILLIAAISLKAGKLNYEGVGIVIAFYIGIMCIMVTKAISMNWSSVGFSIFTLLFAVGSLLYGISDIILANNKFKYKDSKWLSPLNLGLYYTGIGIIAIFSAMFS